MSRQLISIINGVEISAEVNENGQIFVPIKPICNVIGIDFAAQYNKLQGDETLASTIAIIATVASDEKAREMICLPLQYVYGWLFTINPGKVSPDARDAVMRYRRECYDVLYNHFTCSMQRTIETNNAEIELLQQINAAISDEKEAKGRRKKAEEALSKLRSERLNPKPSLFS